MMLREQTKKFPFHQYHSQSRCLLPTTKFGAIKRKDHQSKQILFRLPQTKQRSLLFFCVRTSRDSNHSSSKSGQIATNWQSVRSDRLDQRRRSAFADPLVAKRSVSLCQI